MPQQTHATRRPATKQQEPEAVVEAEAPARSPEAQRVLDETEALLDEIDSVLEQDAETFVRGYIQKGGQ